MASYSSYNLLKAAADGLADAINYRTNLKRRRREEEYNYNRDWQRNENEYQRDLGREREKLDYITDYNWKQQQKAHDRQIEWDNQAREAKRARLTDFFDTYNPANVNPYNRADVYNYNTKAIANGVDYLLKPEQSPEEALKEKEALLNLQLKFDREKAKDSFAKQKALIDYQNANKPKEKNPYEQLLATANKISNETGMPLDHAIALVKSGKLTDIPSSVKGGGGSGRSAVMEQGSIPHLDKELQYYQNKIDNLDKEITNYENQNQINLNDYYQKVNSIINDNSLNQEQKEKKLKDLEKETLANIAQTKGILKNLYADRDAAQANLDYATRYKYNNEYSASGTQFIHIPTMQSKTNSFLDGFIKEEEDKEKARNNIASNTPPLRPFVNPYDSNSIPKSIHIPFEEGLDPEQKRLYDKWNKTDSAAFYMGWDDNRRRR